MTAGQVVTRSHQTGGRWGSLARWRLRFVAVIASALTLIAGCTATGSPTPPPSATSSATSPTGTSGTTSPAARPGQLSCADAYTTDPIGDLPKFTDSGIGFYSLSKKGQDPIPADQTNLPSDASGYFLKSPVYLDKGVSWVEVTVIEGDVTFLWVPAGVWIGPRRWSVVRYQSRTVRFESCKGSYTGFLGGIRTPAARECATLGLRSSIQPQVEQFQVAIGKGACD